MAAKLSIITHFYDSNDGIGNQIRHWKGFDPGLLEQIEFILIDDFSPGPPQIAKEHLNLRLFRVTDDIDWNMPGCRNLGAVQAQSDWCLFFDIDNIVDEKGLSLIVQSLPMLDRSTLYRFRRIHDGREVDSHINSFLISRWGFFKAGAYDEDFAGHYGFEDVHFHNMWRKHVGSQVLLTDIVFQQLHYRTSGLDRDLERNQALIKSKVEAGCVGSVGKLRFAWLEVDL